MARRKRTRKISYRAKKRRGGHRSKKKVPLMITGGAILSLQQALMTPQGGYVPWTVIKSTDTTAVKITKLTNAAKGAGWIQIATPVVLGIAGSAIAGKVGANRYFAKIPLLGKVAKL